MATAFLLALALLTQDAPMATSTPAAQPAPARTSALSAPSDEYGYVGWCYGALGGYIDLYDQVMPEVTRIEKAFPGPSGVDEALKTYPEMREQARGDLKIYRAAIVAAEKASPRPISEYGGVAIKRGRSVWAGSDQTNKARLAQVWMSWSPPGDCETRARNLEKKSNILGKALIYNAAKPVEQAPGQALAPVPEPAAVTAPAPPVEQAAPPEPAIAEMPKLAPVAKTPVAKTPAKAPTVKAATSASAKTTPAKPAAAKPVAAKPVASAKAEFVIDMADPKPCPGSLEPAKRNGKDVLVCKPD